MIYSASTLLLASLVVNAALVFGAPIRTSPSPNVARAADDDSVLLSRTTRQIVPEPNVQRSVDPDPSEARSIHQAREIAPEIAIRNTAPSDEVEARDPLPEIAEIVRRYPRRSLYERHETRSTPSSPPEARSPPGTESPPVERRFFRRELFERHQTRTEAPTPPEAREAKPLEDPIRRFPRKILAEYYVEKRTPEPAPAPPTIPDAPVARSPQPEPELSSNRIVRRFARRGMAEQVEARQDPTDTPVVPPAENLPPVPVPSPAASSSAASLNAAATPVVSGSASASVSASSAGPTTTLVAATNPVVEILGANKGANFVNPSTLPNNGLPVEIDRENETTVYHQKTTEHISQCNGEVKVNPGVAASASASAPIPSGTSASAAVPSASGAPVVPTVTPPVAPVVPPVVPAQGNAGDNANPNVDPTKPTSTDANAVPSQVVDAQLNPAPTAAVLPVAANTDGTVPPVPNVAPVRRDDEVADAIILRGRALGYSGPAYASYLKRSTMN